MSNIYSRMKIFHFKGKLDSLRSDEVKPPVHIRIKPTNVCNHSCSYCAYRAESLQLGQNMNVRDYIPEQKMVEIIEDISEMGVKAVTFSGGGEPLIYPYINRTVKELINKGIAFATLTNGANLKGEIAELFASKGTWVRVSVDGWDDDSYKIYRGTGDREYTKIIENMEAFARLNGKCTLGISIIVDERNSGRVYEMIRSFRDAGADSVKVSPCIVSNNGVENNNYHKPFFNIVKEQVKRAESLFGAEDFVIFDAYHELEEKFNKEYNWCPYLQILPVIGADQNVYSCQDKAYNLESGLLGSIKDQRFRDFWYRGKEKFFSIDPSVECSHHCVANGKNQMVLDYLTADSEHLGFV